MCLENCQAHSDFCSTKLPAQGGALYELHPPPKDREDYQLEPHSPLIGLKVLSCLQTCYVSINFGLQLQDHPGSVTLNAFVLILGESLLFALPQDEDGMESENGIGFGENCRLPTWRHG